MQMQLVRVAQWDCFVGARKVLNNFCLKATNLPQTSDLSLSHGPQAWKYVVYTRVVVEGRNDGVYRGCVFVCQEHFCRWLCIFYTEGGDACYSGHTLSGFWAFVRCDEGRFVLTTAHRVNYF